MLVKVIGALLFVGAPGVLNNERVVVCHEQVSQIRINLICRGMGMLDEYP